MVKGALEHGNLGVVKAFVEANSMIVARITESRIMMMFVCCCEIGQALCVASFFVVPSFRKSLAGVSGIHVALPTNERMR